MAILERDVDPFDVPNLVYYLVRGFAVLVKLEARSIESRHAKALHEVLRRMGERADRPEWTATAALIREADAAVVPNITPLP